MSTAVIYPSTVKNLQARLSAGVKGTDDSVRACASMPDAQRSAWGQFYIMAMDFTQKDPGYFGLGTMMDQGEAFEDQLVSWQKSLPASGCKLLVPLYETTLEAQQKAERNAGGPDPAWLTAIKYATVGAVVVAGAYGVSKVVALVPTAKMRDEAKKRRETRGNAPARGLLPARA